MLFVYCLQQKRPFLSFLLTQRQNIVIRSKHYNTISIFNNLSYIVSSKKTVFAIDLNMITSLALSLTGLNTET